MKMTFESPLNLWKHFGKSMSTFILLILIIISCDNQSAESNPYDKPHDPAKPVEVSGIGPEKGGYGTRVVISGSNFGNDPEKIRVSFNEKEALILGVQDNAIYAMCPKQPGDYSTIKVAVKGVGDTFTEVELAGKQFKYLLRAAVTTVAGVFGKNQAIDGPALEASFQRPAKLACDIDGKNIIVVDDNASKIRLVSLTDNKVVTVSSVANPFSCSFNTQYDKCFVLIRAAARRPELFVALSKENNYMSPVMYYDEKDDNGNYIFGGTETGSLTADDEYVYIMSQYAAKLVRIHQITGKVELIGQNLDIPASFIYMTFNAKDKKLYAYAESAGRLYRLDPKHTPAGRTTPWITNDEVEYVLGNGSGTAVEGYGDQARCPCSGITADVDGNLYGCDITNHVVWKFDVNTRQATIFAGTPGVQGYKDGKPREAILGRPLDVTTTADGIVYIAETTNFLIRSISIQ